MMKLKLKLHIFYYLNCKQYKLTSYFYYHQIHSITLSRIKTLMKIEIQIYSHRKVYFLLSQFPPADILRCRNELMLLEEPMGNKMPATRNASIQ